uniref:Hypothetical conserved protein n=1 Tax=uncultured prokaryote TaxID=198431 RepID=H5SPW8_9ZZZZ|nr:hypothetical conserved protein [uncultured prokaryote]
MKGRRKKDISVVSESSEKYISDEELISLLEKRVPEIIERMPSLKKRLKDLFSDVFVERGDIERILEEMRFQREASEKKFEALINELKAHREDTNKRFEEMDRRFEALANELKAHREDTNKRFEEMDRRFEALANELKAHREDTNRRFEALANELKAHREDTNRRFEALANELKAHREDTNRRFEALANELKAHREDTNKRLEELRKDFMSMVESLSRKIESTVGAIGSRWGVGAENAIREGLREIVGEIGLRIEKWRRMDSECRVFLYPREAEIDILIKDGKIYAIEVKSSLTHAEVENFERSVRYYEMVEGKRVDKKIILAVYVYRGAAEYASHFGIKIISQPEEIKEI